MHQEGLLFSDLYIHLPVAQIQQRLPEFVAQKWQPELALQTDDLDQLTPSDLENIRLQLKNVNLRCTIHAPFLDLNPASSDRDIKQITARRFLQTLDFAAAVEASRIVYHPGYDPWRYARAPESWLNNSLEFWPDLVQRAKQFDILLCLENIFDTKPAPLSELLATINSPNLRHCFDIGHWFLFSQIPLAEWFTELGPYLAHLHLHDNNGRGDDHRPVGKGKIDFPAFISQLEASNTNPTVTLEAHSLKDAATSLKGIEKLLKKL